MAGLDLGLVALSAHDSCDWTLDVFREALGDRYRTVKVGEEISRGLMSEPAEHRAGRGPTLGAAPDKRLILSLALNLLITLLQVAGGIIANSLGLLSDAAHNLSDVVALGLSLWAVRLGRRPATPRRTFAYKRAEILVAMFNSAVLVAISVYIIVEAVRRLLNPQPVDGLWVVGFAAGWSGDKRCGRACCSGRTTTISTCAARSSIWSATRSPAWVSC